MVTKRVGLIGYPVEHSVSPAMHNAAFETLGLIDWHYELLPTPPESLVERIAALKTEGFVGANVTIPHKQGVMPLLDRVMMAARGIGAVNTIFIEEGRSEGHNTDSVGFIMDLNAHQVDYHGKRALVLGAGGSAHAVVLGLANAGVEVVVMTRREQAAWEMREQLRRGVSAALRIVVKPLATLAEVAPTVDLIVNCTPLGMHPNTNSTPWETDAPIPAMAVVYDLVYRPQETRFMREAKTAGARAIGGLGMLIYQGAAAFELWTGQTAPLEVMRAAAEKQLGI